jgi:DNA repair photolyase
MSFRSKIMRPASPLEDAPPIEPDRRRGRGANSNATSRYDAERRGAFDDGWDTLGGLAGFKTELLLERARTIIATNDSPDISFSQSINPYRGCEHGCIYCYARPSHSYLGFSAGLDFETKIIAKPNAPDLLLRELSRPSYRPQPIMLGSNTDPYQPVERSLELTRRLLEIFDRASHPVGVVTKSALVTRDIDILASLARRDLAKVAISLTTLDRRLARRMEPRAATPQRRIEAMQALAGAGIPVVAMTAPIVPALNDAEIEALLETAAGAGATEAAYVLLRLPLEISPLFREWLAEEFPDRAKRVMSLMRSMRGGKDYDATFGERHVGRGPYAEQIALRYRLALQRLGLNKRRFALRCDLFRKPEPDGQLGLF